MDTTMKRSMDIAMVGKRVVDMVMIQKKKKRRMLMKEWKEDMMRTCMGFSFTFLLIP